MANYAPTTTSTFRRPLAAALAAAAAAAFTRPADSAVVTVGRSVETRNTISLEAVELPAWQAAQQKAMILHAELRQARAALEQRIGPRGLTLGSVTLPSGRSVPIQAASPDQAKKLWRRLNLGREHEPERAAVMAQVRAACERWDIEAERAGLGELERKALAARDRAKALTAQVARAA